ncbi:MAG: stage V sporulation protein AD [Lachnospiraceae bacterium]|nr:stage V sporulation protein AD [Lachnospiraceae bacterium]
MEQMIGKQSLKFTNAPYIIETACIAGKKEGEGPLGKLFDKVCEDGMFGKNTWEEAESELQKETIALALSKASYTPSDMRYIFAGDLLGQLIASSFGVKDYNIPFFGVYGACSTMAETMALASMTVAAGYANKVMAVASSHFASAEKQFRFPLAYGNQRPLSSTWTVTGCGAVIIGNETSAVKITGITTGKIVDYGVKDSMNMGACMAPAAADLIYQNFMDFGVDASYYDKIVTGDLGSLGQEILITLMKEKGFDISKVHMDCGIEIFDSKTQNTASGGSGCGCAAVTLCAYLLRKMKKEWKRILFVPTGALLYPTSFNEGKSIPGVAHGIILERNE